MTIHDTGLRARNTVTPRIFVAATRQDDGKTTTSLGLFAALQKRFHNIGYIKPVGQRFVDVEGVKIDEDTVLINETYQVRTPLRAMSPIAVEQDFTRRYLANGINMELHRQVVEAFDEASWEKDFIIIEGTGHAGVGSVFDLSNAVVAHLLRSKVIIVCQGGIGRPIDEIALSLALFEKHGVEVIGAVFNKVLPEKIESLTEYAERGLARLGLPMLGVIPLHQELHKPTLNQIYLQLKGNFLSGGQYKRRRISRITIGAMSSRNVEAHFEPGTLIITPSDRDDIITAVLGDIDSARAPIAGVLLTGGLPTPEMVNAIRQRDIPFIAVQGDIYSIASAIHEMTFKTEVGDSDKIEVIQDLVQKHVLSDRILDLIQGEPCEPELPLNDKTVSRLSAITEPEPA
jgi:BioD-like phosphotransacetylase family protein